ncbi:MAG TPA: dTDP-4-dehydrorhamnose reductase [Caulobacteraceae bacterium]|nr:dTDP-4-dehydrorhamnose reductase [Caulobacteraceae bacterium]
MSRLRVLMIGAEGQVVRALHEAAAGAPDVVLGCAARPDVDLTRPETIAPALAAFGPDLVVNPAAYTAVDQAESEPDLAFAVNRDGAGAVAAAAHALGAPIIHVSTDYVFDGEKAGPYLETDAPAPRTVYGRSKLAGEAAVAAAAPRHVILRTAWVYAPWGRNFVRTMARLSAERDALQVVDDQVGCPTYAPDIAAAVLAIARRIGAEGWRNDFAGVTHLAGPDALSWCGFARRIVAEGARRGVARCVPVTAIATADYPTPALRPANSQLATQRLASLFGVGLPPLEASLRDCLARMAQETPT